MRNHIRQLLSPARKTRHLRVAAALATLFAFYAPAASAGGLLGGVHALFVHHQAGSVYRASDYLRTPHRNYAPAIVASYAMTTATSFALYEPYSSGGSVVINSPVEVKKGHSARIAKHSGYAKPAVKKTKPRHKMNKRKYVRLKGVNRKTFSCTGYESRPESFVCTKIRTEYIPRKGPWIDISSISNSH